MPKPLKEVIRDANQDYWEPGYYEAIDEMARRLRKLDEYSRTIAEGGDCDDGCRGEANDFCDRCLTLLHVHHILDGEE